MIYFIGVVVVFLLCIVVSRLISGDFNNKLTASEFSVILILEVIWSVNYYIIHSNVWLPAIW